MSKCTEQEADDYPWLESVAQEVAGPVADHVRRGSFCEDALEPGASVMVSVYDWTTRDQARAYLREVGIAVPNPRSPVAFDGAQINYATSVDYSENDGRPYVTIWFYAPTTRE